MANLSWLQAAVLPGVALFPILPVSHKHRQKQNPAAGRPPTSPAHQTPKKCGFRESLHPLRTFTCLHAWQSSTQHQPHFRQLQSLKNANRRMLNGRPGQLEGEFHPLWVCFADPFLDSPLQLSSVFAEDPPKSLQGVVLRK